MKGRGWVGKNRAAVGILFACVATWVLAQSSLVSAAGDPSAELSTAVTHAGFAAKYETMKEITLHLHHALNCLVGPQDKLFDPAAGNPCQGQGDGYLPDQKAAKRENTNQYHEVWWAVQIAAQAVASDNMGAAKAAARIVNMVLENAAKSK
jgi:hypothetical protein